MCDEPGCDTAIDRGLGYLCGEMSPARLTASATLPANIGQGDELVIGADTYHIFSRDSATQVTVHAPAIALHTALPLRSRAVAGRRRRA